MSDWNSIHFGGNLCAAAHRALMERRTFNYLEAGLKETARLEAACTVLSGIKGLSWFAFGIAASDARPDEMSAKIEKFGRAHLVNVKEASDCVTSVDFAFVDCLEARMANGLIGLLNSLVPPGGILCISNAPSCLPEELCEESPERRWICVQVDEPAVFRKS